MNPDVIDLLRTLGLRWTHLSQQWRHVDPSGTEADILALCARELAEVTERIRHHPDAPDPA